MKLLTAAKVAAALAVVVGLAQVYLNHVLMETKLQVDWDACWNLDKAACNNSIAPSVALDPLHVDQKVLEDLKLRLGMRRPISGLAALAGEENWDRGISPDWLEAAMEHWATAYDWRAAEARINAEFNPKRATIDGLGIHFWHVPAPDPDKPVVPLVLLHGWPGSLWEFNGLIPELIKRTALNLEIVAPSLPGYGWSQAAEKPGLDACAIAVIVSKLMTRALGHSSYFVQGGDWGSFTAHCLAEIAPPGQVLGTHVNMPLAAIPWWAVPYSYFLESDPRERAKVLPILGLPGKLVGQIPYMLQQMTRPVSIGIALNDSPVASAAWILDKFHLWTDPHVRVSLDDLLTNLMFYWVPAAHTSAAMLYKETLWSAKAVNNVKALIVKPFPHRVGISDFPYELFPPAQVVVRSRYSDIVSLRVAERGGHFAALENPRALAEHVLEFVELCQAAHRTTKE